MSETNSVVYAKANALMSETFWVRGNAVGRVHRLIPVSMLRLQRIVTVVLYGNAEQIFWLGTAAGRFAHPGRQRPKSRLP